MGNLKGGMTRKNRRKSVRCKSVRWSAVPLPCLSRLRLKLMQVGGQSLLGQGLLEDVSKTFRTIYVYSCSMQMINRIDTKEERLASKLNYWSVERNGKGDDCVTLWIRAVFVVSSLAAHWKLLDISFVFVVLIVVVSHFINFSTLESLLKLIEKKRIKTNVMLHSFCYLIKNLSLWISSFSPS